jgi:hypothetical protein
MLEFAKLSRDLLKKTSVGFRDRLLNLQTQPHCVHGSLFPEALASFGVS